MEIGRQSSETVVAEPQRLNVLALAQLFRHVLNEIVRQDERFKSSRKH